MPNFLALILWFAYQLSLTLWVGGAIVLGALTAPELFRQLPRPQAGAIFGPILRRFARIRLAAIVVAILAAFVRLFTFEKHALSPWIALRWAALVVMAVAVTYEILVLEPAMQRHRAAIRSEDAADPERVAFMVLHKRSEALMKMSVGAALLAMFLS